MSLEAIAALLGHRSLRMTLVYARIADRKVADEYFTVTEQVEALYTADQPALPASAEGEAMRRLRLEMQRRDLGNGYRTRPPELDCAFETVCQTCVHFGTGPEFVPVLLRQRDHAVEREHTQLVTIYDRLLDHIETDDEPSPTYAGEHQISPDHRHKRRSVAGGGCRDRMIGARDTPRTHAAAGTAKRAALRVR